MFLFPFVQDGNKNTETGHTGLVELWQQTINNILGCLGCQVHLKFDLNSSADECIPRDEDVIDISYHSILSPIKIPKVFSLSVYDGNSERKSRSSERVPLRTAKSAAHMSLHREVNPLRRKRDGTL